MRWYLSGPMTGLPNLNIEAFHAEAARMRAEGFEVVNPAEFNFPPDAAWSDCLRFDIKALMGCQAIRMLPGWQSSEGAQLEHHNATKLGFMVSYAADAEAQNCAEHIDDAQPSGAII